MKKGYTGFLLLGVPCWIITLILLVFDWFAGALFTILEIIAFYFVLIHGRKQDRIQQLTKIGFVMALISIGGFVTLVNKPAVWGEQIARAYNLDLLITPDDENVQILKNRFDAWVATSPNVTWAKYASYIDNGLLKWEWYTYEYKDFINLSWDALDELEQAMVIDYYIKKYIIEWTNDTFVYGVRDYKATPHQILNQNIKNGWTEPAKDDCDGIAVVTVSLMRNYGLKAYISEGKSHWFTCVVLSENTMEKHGLDNPVFFDYWQSVHVWAYFDSKEFHLGQNPVMTVLDLILIEDENVFTEFYDFAERFPFLLYSLLPIVSLILVLFIGYPRYYENAEEDEKRQLRNNKIVEKWNWSQNKHNPISWLLYLTYVRTGNPFRKVYLNEWINTIIGTILILIPLQLMLTYQGMMTMYTLIYLNLYILAMVFVIRQDAFIKIKDLIQTKFAKNPIEIEKKEIPSADA
jgi:hypothetical protein